MHDDRSVIWTRDSMRAGHKTSWFALSVPLVLTTAFVIVGAWRRAVRAKVVDVEPVDEEE